MLIKTASSEDRPEVIHNLLRFLKENQNINRQIQIGFIKEAFSADSVSARALLLLYQIAQTQSQPKLDKLKMFFEKINKHNALSDFTAFGNAVNISGRCPKNLSLALSLQDGWGTKTAALFVRALAVIQNTADLSGKFWQDLEVMKHNHIMLPVDKVILCIFQKISPQLGNRHLKSFSSINKYLSVEMKCSQEEMLLLDDLWLWGFITQKSNTEDNERELMWNVAKYWAISHSPKDDVSIEMMEKKSKKFISILEGQN